MGARETEELFANQAKALGVICRRAVQLPEPVQAVRFCLDGYSRLPCAARALGKPKAPAVDGAVVVPTCDTSAIEYVQEL